MFHGSTEIWHSARPISRRLRPGHTLRRTAVWDGKHGQADVAIAPGTYTVEAVAGGESASTTIRITA